MSEIITIGSATQDIFISNEGGQIITIKGMFEEKELLCLGYGDKIEVDKPIFDIGGGAINTACNFKNLGFDTAPIVKVGRDVISHSIRERLAENEIDASLVITGSRSRTGFSVILTSFEGDRTVFTHRGANGKIKEKDIPWDRIKKADWIYIAPLSKESNLVVAPIVAFAKKNNVQIAYNAGGTALQNGFTDLKKAIKEADVLLMNKSEASKITGIDLAPGSTCPTMSNFDVRCDVYKMFKKLKSIKAKVTIITDGNKGAVAYDGEYLYKVGVFPAVKVMSTLGAGDAFSSTFTASLIKYDWDVEKALKSAAVNAAGVVEVPGAQLGFRDFEEIEHLLKEYPGFKVKKAKFSEIQQ